MTRPGPPHPDRRSAVIAMTGGARGGWAVTNTAPKQIFPWERAAERTSQCP